MKQDVQSFFFRLRKRGARLEWNDKEVRDSIKKSLTIGADDAWVALVRALGFSPEVLAAAALKPIAVGLVISGVNQLCQGSS